MKAEQEAINLIDDITFALVKAGHISRLEAVRYLRSSRKIGLIEAKAYLEAKVPAELNIEWKEPRLIVEVENEIGLAPQEAHFRAYTLAFHKAVTNLLKQLHEQESQNNSSTHRI